MSTNADDPAVAVVVCVAADTVVAASVATVHPWGHEATAVAAGYQYTLYPPENQMPLHTGQRVFVRPNAYGCATVIGPIVTKQDDRFVGRVPVCYDSDESQFHANPKRIVPKYGGRETGQVLICFSTDHYRQLARSQPDKADFVVELGSSYGRASCILAQTCGRLLAVDNSKESQLARLHFSLCLLCLLLSLCAVLLFMDTVRRIIIATMPLQEAIAETRQKFPHIDFQRFDVIVDRQKLLRAADGCSMVCHAALRLELIQLVGCHPQYLFNISDKTGIICLRMWPHSC